MHSCAFARLAACQWNRGQYRLHPGGAEINEYEQLSSRPNNTNALRTSYTLKVPNQFPGTMMLLTRRGWHFAKGGQGNYWKEAFDRGLVSLPDLQWFHQ